MPRVGPWPARTIPTKKGRSTGRPFPYDGVATGQPTSSVPAKK